MDSNSFKTKAVNLKTIQKSWFIVNAENKVLGRISSEIVKILRGKNQSFFTPNFDCGDYVIVINSDKIKLTGKKWRDKKYIRHTGYPGGQRETTPLKLKEDKSSKFIIENAVKGMLPKNRLGRKLFNNLFVFALHEDDRFLHNLFVYEGSDHPHEGQKPKEIDV